MLASPTGVFASVGGVIASAIAIWFAMPSDLEVNAGPPDYSQPFDVPFTVVNPNTLFDINDAQFSCDINLKTDKGLWIMNTRTKGEGPKTVERNEKDTLKCYFPFETNSTIVQASVEIRSVYKKFPELHESAHKLGSYRWDNKANPPRWTTGHLIGRS